METAEWAVGRPDLSTSMRHKPADVWNQFVEFYKEIPYPRNSYSWTIKFPCIIPVDTISVCLNTMETEKTGINLNIEVIRAW